MVSLNRKSQKLSPFVNIMGKHGDVLIYLNSHELFSTNTCKSGPGHSKLLTSLVNVLLKFQMLISEICKYFMLKKCKTLMQIEA